MSNPHINADGRFQSDKYPTTPAGKVPLSVSDTTAQDLLWEYAQRRRSVDAEFSEAVEQCLMSAGFPPGKSTLGGWRCFHCGQLCLSADEARTHFGDDQGETPICQIPALAELCRDQQRELERLRSEDFKESTAEIMGLMSRHAAAVREAEERGFERGMRDMARRWYSDVGVLLAAVHQMEEVADEALDDEGGLVAAVRREHSLWEDPEKRDRAEFEADLDKAVDGMPPWDINSTLKDVAWAIWKRAKGVGVK